MINQGGAKMPQDSQDLKNNDNYKKWVMNKLYEIKDNCSRKNNPEFSNDDFLEIYSHLIKLINMCENKKLRTNLKQELEKIKQCCDENCQCIHRSKNYLKIFDNLKHVIEESFYKFNWNNKNKEKKRKSMKEESNETEKKEDITEDIEDVNLEKQIDKIKNILDDVLVKKEDNQNDIDTENYGKNVFETNSYKVELDYDKNIKVETDFPGDSKFEQNTIEDVVNSINIDENDEKSSDSNSYSDNDDLSKKIFVYDLGNESNYNENLEYDDYDLMDIFAYIYNLGKQSIKPGESVAFDQKPILSTTNNISFKEPSSIIINESGIYDLLYYAQTEEKDINLALYINDNEIKETCANTTSYSNTICSQGLIVVPETELPVTITLRNTDVEKDAIFNKSIKTGEVNLSILIRKIS